MYNVKKWDILLGWNCTLKQQTEITQRQHEQGLWFFCTALCTALCIIETTSNAKFHVNQAGDDKVILWTGRKCSKKYKGK